jgi:hypothetical protein
MLRTLCANDPELPVFTEEELATKGWLLEYRLPNNEIVFFKKDIMGFLNSQTGHFVTCPYSEKLDNYCCIQMGWICCDGVYRPASAYVGCLE